MITIEAVQTRQRFGRLRKRLQWRWLIRAGNHEPIDPRDTATNPDSIDHAIGLLLDPTVPVKRVRYYLDGEVEEKWLRQPMSAIPSMWDEDGKPVGFIDLVNVHPELACAGRDCVIHNPTDHHMRSWPLHWRNDRGLFERICTHGVGHPDPDQFAYWRAAAEKWRPPLNADILDDPYPPSNPFDGMGVHGCDGCCRALGKSGT